MLTSHYFEFSVSSLHLAEAYSEPSQTSKMELCVKLVNSLQPLTLFLKNSILDVWLGCEYASIRCAENGDVNWV